MVSLKVSSGAGHEFTVPAPRDGVVVDKSVLVDQQVSPDSSGTLMVVADLSSVWVIVDLFESEALALRPGVAARVTSPSLPGMEEEGRVEMVSSVVDPARHTLPVRIRLANPQGRLRPNLYARVRFAAAPPRDAVEVPAAAVLSDGERQYVYVEDGAGRFARREVSVGAAHAGRLAVLLASGPVRGWRRKGRFSSTTSWRSGREAPSACLRDSSGSRCATRWPPSCSRP
jgi:RND family efflux transporter MFP subunit